MAKQTTAAPEKKKKTTEKAASTVAKARVLDFSNVKESSGINPKRMEQGDYLAKATAVTETLKDGIPMWCFIFTLNDFKTATYPYYCKLQSNQLWKVNNLYGAAGLPISKKKGVTVNPLDVLNVPVGITLGDDEYEGKEKSVIEAIFPASELMPEEPPKKKGKKSKMEMDLDDL